MSKERRFGLGKFVLGAAVGAGLGVLFAPKKGEEIKMELVDLDKEKALEIAKEKGAALKTKAQELVDLAVEKGTPVLKKTANDILENVIKVSKETQKKLAKEDK